MTQMCVCLSSAYIQAVRGLLMVGLCLGLIGTVLTFFGLECTRIGGDQRSKDRMLMTASASHLVGCEYEFAFTDSSSAVVKAASQNIYPLVRVVFVFFPMCHRLSLMQASQTWLLIVYT